MSVLRGNRSQPAAGRPHQWILQLLLILLATPPVWGALGLDVIQSTDRSSTGTSITSPSFSTASTNELLLAFISTDAYSPGVTVTGVTGAGLTWSLVQRANAQLGCAEIWRAFAPARLSRVTARANLSQSVAASITVVSFTGADPSGTGGSGAIGNHAGVSAPSGAPAASLFTTRNGSWVFGVGDDWDQAIPRTLGPNQTMVHQYLARYGDTFWVQRQNSPTPLSGTQVFINDTAPATDRYNLSIVEVLAAGAAGGSTFSIAGAVSPSSSGAGTLLTLSGASIGAVSADSAGNYSFPGLTNGSYTVTPTKTGFTFVPTNQSVVVSGSNVTGVNFTATPVPTWSISGTVSPASLGSNTLLTLSGTGSATTLANGAGSYTFAGLANGTYTVTPGKADYSFTPSNQVVTVSGANVSGVDFTAQPPPANYPDLSDIIPTGRMSIVGTGTNRQFQYTHDTFNGGSGPLAIQPVYNPASGTYQGYQLVYAFRSGSWSLVNTIPVAGAFVFDAAHGHFHFPFAAYGLYVANPDGSIGAPVALSAKTGFCIADSFIYDSSLPNAGAFGNWGSCGDPTSLRGLSIGAVDEYDQTDEGQAISLAGVPDGTYWLRAMVDPYNYLAESNERNNETDVKLTISGTSLTVLQSVTPVLNPPPDISLISPVPGTFSGSVQLAAGTAQSSVQFLVDGLAFGNPVTGPPFALNWDTTTVQNGNHWLAAQTQDATGRIGTSPVIQVTVSNTASVAPTVQVTDPQSNATVSAVITVSATATAQIGVPTVQFYVDNVALGAPVTNPPYMTTWDTQRATAGAHTLTASAVDQFGLIGNSAPVPVIVDNSHPANPIGIDRMVSQDAAGVMQTPAFSTSTASDLLVAFVGYDGPQTGSQTATVSGAGLLWQLAMRSNTQLGTSEIWVAQASNFLTSVTVQSQPGIGSYHGSLTVLAFTNAAGIGLVGRSGAPSGAPDIYLPGVFAGNWVFAVGNDWDRAVARTPVSGQYLVHQRIDTQTGDTFWVQATTTPSTADALVDIHDSAPTSDQWNYAAVEVVATRQ